VLHDDFYRIIYFLLYVLFDLHQKEDHANKLQDFSLPGGPLLKQHPSCPSDEVRIASRKIGITRLPNLRMYEKLVQWIPFVQN